MKNIQFLTIAMILLAATACRKEKNNNNCVAGTGGDLTIAATLKHHSQVILNKATYLDTVYVKFNTQDAPGENPSDYDTYFVGEAGEDHVHMAGLKCGNYYLLGAGYDSTINQRVIGGIPYSTSNTTGEIDIIIPVTEGD